MSGHWTPDQARRIRNEMRLDPDVLWHCVQALNAALLGDAPRYHREIRHARQEEAMNVALGFFEQDLDGQTDRCRFVCIAAVAERWGIPVESVVYRLNRIMGGEEDTPWHIMNDD